MLPRVLRATTVPSGTARTAARAGRARMQWRACARAVFVTEARSRGRGMRGRSRGARAALHE